MLNTQSIFIKIMFGLNFDSLLNGNVSVGLNGLFKLNISDQECTVTLSVC